MALSREAPERRASPAPTAPRAGAVGGRAPRWSGPGLVAVAAAGLVALPLLVLPAQLLDGASGAWSRLAGNGILGDAVLHSVALALAVGAGALVLGTALAVLIAFYDFPGRSFLSWALVLPLALPGYVLAYVLLRQWDVTGPVQSLVRRQFGPDAALPEIRSLWGAALVFVLVLYPYVYLLVRAAFLGQSRSQLEAARALGASPLGAILRVAVPAARPALAAGTALVMMDALADFGTVSLLRVPTVTEAVYRVWYGGFDREGATELATILLALALLLVVAERLARGRRRFHQLLERGLVARPVRLHGWRAALAVGLPGALLVVAFAAPVAELAVWSAEALGDGESVEEFPAYLRHSVVLAGVSAALACAVAAAIAFGSRVAPSRVGRAAARIAGLGYAVPGTVVAVAVITVYAWVDRRWIDAGEGVGLTVGLVLTGSAVGLVLAYVIRFLAVALGTLDASLTRIPANLDEAGRSLGATGLDAFRRIHLPLLRPGLLAALLLVFVEVVKELPATMLLRPFGWDTLAVAVWQATGDARWEAAALPSLAIVLAGLGPVAVLVHLSRPRHR